VRYFKTIPEVKQMGDQAQVKHLRLSGRVKAGSIKREGSKTVFLLVDNPAGGDAGDNLTVVYDGSDLLPLTLKDRAQAVADGKLNPDGTFHATQIQGKCATFSGWSSFEIDGDKPVTLRGIVTRTAATSRLHRKCWSNP
jgi:cytochrome c-type biogenesis protein CcmE